MGVTLLVGTDGSWVRQAGWWFRINDLDLGPAGRRQLGLLVVVVSRRKGAARHGDRQGDDGYHGGKLGHALQITPPATPSSVVAGVAVGQRRFHCRIARSFSASTKCHQSNSASVEANIGLPAENTVAPDREPTKPVQLALCAKGQLHVCTIAEVPAPRRSDGSPAPRGSWLATGNGAMPAAISCELLWALPAVTGSAS